MDISIKDKIKAHNEEMKKGNNNLDSARIGFSKQIDKLRKEFDEKLEAFKKEVTAYIDSKIPEAPEVTETKKKR